MISKADILKMAQHVTKRGNDIPDRKLLHPNREWVIGLGIFLVLTIAGAVYNTLLFRYYLGVESTVTANALERAEYKQTLITEVLAEYGARSAAFEALHATYSEAPVVEDASEEVIE